MKLHMKYQLQLSLAVLFQLYHSTAGYTGDGPPTFLVRPQDSRVPNGSTLVLFCRASGQPLPSIMWLMNGHTIAETRFKIKTLPDALSILRIENVKLADSGKIVACTAENGIGDPLKTESSLTVFPEDQVPPGFPVIEAHPVMKSVESGRTAHLSCRVSGEPTPKVLWLKNSIPVNVKNNPRYSVSTMGNPGALMIQKAKEEDQGRYECVASNDLGVVHSKAVHLFVKERQNPPYFSFKLPPVHRVPSGGAVNLTCVAVGYPMPRVFWRRQSDGEILNDPQTAPIGRNVLTVTDVRSTESYKCVAVSKLGSIDATTVVQPDGPFIPVPPPVNLRIVDVNDTSVKIRWDPVTRSEKIAKFIVTYQVKFDSRTVVEKIIFDVASNQAHIQNLVPFKHYQFTVKAVTASGRQSEPSSPIEAHTAQQPAESAPSDVRVRPLTEKGSVLVEWTAPDEDLYGTVTGYKVIYTDVAETTPEDGWKQKDIGTRDTATTINGLDLANEHYIKVKTMNSKGASPWSNVARIVVKPDNGWFYYF
ncbi:unnamed protein product [Bursaphelenchus okinawaensis]|uniref:protein-tyrosine-phosphatase n=1 Tax=Bursaphelenchus okinawaensis TaxID=465554 RepID=A0A811JZN4_9BILA|nr:unnamed protein product [Bursaphelenchus okinawaensis]CAG9088376.1 unnamed protein product [Bursaphelenchus okinawaensis]